MLLCIGLAIAAAILGAIAVGATSVGVSNGRQYRARLNESAQHLGRAHLRIEVLERMLDESRANALNVPAPRGHEAPELLPLPPEVVAELDEIEDDSTRAELEADVRLQMALNPGADPIALVRSVIGA